MRPHIVMLSRSLPFHGVGGMEMVAWDLARQFVADGVKVTFVTTSIRGKCEEFLSEGVYVVALKDAPSRRYSRAWWRLSKEYFEKRLMHSVTAVLSVSTAAYGLLPLKSRLPDIPFVLQLHGSWRGEILSKWRTKDPKMWLASLYNMMSFTKDIRRYSQFDVMVCVGDAVIKDLHRFPANVLLPMDRVRLIRNGVDTGLFHPDSERRIKVRASFGWSERNRVVLSISRLHVQKGIGLGLAGFARYAELDSDARYLVVGSGPERGSLEILAKDLGIVDKVIFAGSASRKEVADYYRAADIFLFTTIRSEVGISLNVLEALASGLPVVMSNHLQGISGLEGIWRIDPRSEEDIAHALAKGLAEEGERSCKLPKNYTLSHCVKEYYRVMRVFV